MKKRKAILNIDLENDFCPPNGTLAVPGGDEIMDDVNTINDYGSKRNWVLVYTADKHKEETVHFKEFGGLWPKHCIDQTWGSQFHPDLKVVPGSIIIVKGTDPTDPDGYSPFEPKAHDDKGRQLEEILLVMNVEEVYICGLATDYCVKAAALDAAKAGFKTYVILDACRAVNVERGDEEKAIEEMEAVGVIMTTTKAVMEMEEA